MPEACSGGSFLDEESFFLSENDPVCCSYFFKILNIVSFVQNSV